MSPEYWRRIQDIVQETLERESHQWPHYLYETCGNDVDLFLEVSTLLAAHREVGDFIERPIIETLKEALARLSEEN